MELILYLVQTEIPGCSLEYKVHNHFVRVTNKSTVAVHFLFH